MNREIPVINRVLHRKDLQRSNGLLMHKIMNLKFANFSALNTSPEKKLPKPREIDLMRIITSTEQKQKRVKPLVQVNRIKTENKMMYTRLANQKSTINNKLFAEERLKNIEYLKRIGKYPYRRIGSVVTQYSEDNGEYSQQKQQHITGEFDSEKLELLLQGSRGRHTFQLREQNRQHLIVLFSKVVQLAKTWYTVKFLRLKNHYQILLQSYPHQKVQYTLRLPEQVGTAMFTQNDYDYMLICTKFIKINYQYICLSVQIGPEKKRHFYRFEKRVTEGEGNEEIQQLKEERETTGLHRKTIFAMENERHQREQKQSQNRRRGRGSDVGSQRVALDILDADIRLSGNEE